MLQARFNGESVRAEPGMRGALCPCCDTEVVAKCGTMITWHFAHKAEAACDPWFKGESDWHLRWKSNSPIERTEVIIGPHRADALTQDGKVVEFQRSTISWDEIQEREKFYRDMIWVFDVADAYEKKRLREVDGEWFWDSPRRSIEECWQSVFLDLGNGVLLELDDEPYREELDPKPTWENGIPVYVRWSLEVTEWRKVDFIEKYLADQPPSPGCVRCERYGPSHVGGHRTVWPRVGDRIGS